MRMDKTTRKQKLDSLVAIQEKEKGIIPGDKIVWFEKIGQSKWKKHFGIYISPTKTGINAEFPSQNGTKVRRHLLWEYIEKDKT
jgi:hypothetical protein